MNKDTTRDRFDLNRRRFLQGSAFAGFAAFLAACSSSGGSPSAAASSRTRCERRARERCAGGL